MPLDVVDGSRPRRRSSLLATAAAMAALAEGAQALAPASAAAMDDPGICRGLPFPDVFFCELGQSGGGSPGSGGGGGGGEGTNGGDETTAASEPDLGWTIPDADIPIYNEIDTHIRDISVGACNELLGRANRIHELQSQLRRARKNRHYARAMAIRAELGGPDEVHDRLTFIGWSWQDAGCNGLYGHDGQD
jgi:hypothetical protein